MMKTQLLVAAISVFGFVLAQSSEKTSKSVAPSPFVNEIVEQETKPADISKLESSLHATNESLMQSISALSRQIGQMSGSYVSKETFVSLEQSVDELKKSVKDSGEDVDLSDLLRRVEALELRCGSVREVANGGSTGSIKTTYQPAVLGYSVSSTSSGGSTGSVVTRSYSTSPETVRIVEYTSYTVMATSAIAQAARRIGSISPDGSLKAIGLLLA